MNSFLNLHSSSAYRNTNRPYYTGTWEYIPAASQYLIPFQFHSSELIQIPVIEIQDIDGSYNDVTDLFFADQPSITSWTESGTGSWGSSGGQITGGSTTTGDSMTSNTFQLYGNTVQFFSIDSSNYSGDSYSFELKKAGVQIAYETLLTLENGFYADIDTSGSDYTIVITDLGGTGGTVTTHTPEYFQTSMSESGGYVMYKGGQLVSPFQTDIFRMRITYGSDIFYSDWCEVCGFSNKTKIKISSSYDYGGIKYSGGYTQFTYKDATVRRAPKAEIEITGDKLNGVIIEEKKVSAVRYKIAMKCTESEYEALVHAMGSTLTITDQTGKIYSAGNIELSEPTWYRSNGIVELSFVDNNNINTWSRNNTAL